LAAEIAGSHHERWDSQVYPLRLTGSAIPLSGRIVALADNFDALTTARPYKEAWSVEKAVEHILGRAGSQFDPTCVQAFKRALPSILRIMLENAEGIKHERAAAPDNNAAVIAA
jgi:putative two-component system response regulator